MDTRLAQREAIRDAEKTDAPSLPLLAIRGFRCFRCLQEADTLSKCGACRRAAYCSIPCQIADWHIAHKYQCHAFQEVNAAERRDSGDKNWEQYTTALHQKAQIAKLAAPAAHSGELLQAVIGQAYCASCYRSPSQLREGQSLHPCKICHLAAVCEDCESSHTAQQCSHNQLLADMEDYKLKHFEDNATVAATITPTKPKRSGRATALSHLDGWLDYFKTIGSKRDVGSFISKDFNFDMPDTAVDADMSHERWRHLLLTTDGLSMPLTVLAALEDIVGLDDLRTLTLHIVGAAGKEFRSLNLFEEILHLAPAIRHLHVVLIGPESPGESAGQTGDFGQEIELDCCQDCATDGRRRTVTSFQGGYHEYALRPAYQKPDLAVLFHSGRSQAHVEEWQPTTSFLIDSRTRTLCTTYTQREAQEETAELDSLDVCFLARPEVNKWRGLAPLPELLEGPEHSAYYNNYYRYVFEGRRNT
ncbi:hypothetical protein KC335_g5175 [Hortaea werneckii]|uniref:MYND-type domain-containing protein n=1 Tax=Hortaea werneckii TaxID=91943 RepID=A0A3M7IMQ9_HORWE|nr:hypothetical protein KC358_g12203 [Hortaea werneckii]KAI6998948.1 hypothetical protein KC329_g1043 [Hortaea werneckii]KAI7036658.1 hypothetical protein KC362_g7188 [Hortaea werneckii]KAI7271134.1 hypothetical protein KC335_g5175 [Hortaea werneckii]KAI7439765.1 hypothetical protein KC368_g11275 [Hortaea werneckii]